MEELIDLIATDSTPSEISDKIKDILYSKASQKIELARPVIANSIFDQSPESEEDTEGEEGEL